MQDQIVVLKNTKQGIQVDTVYSSNDTLFIDFNGKTTLEIPEKRLEVSTFPPEKSDLEIFVSWASIIGGIAGFIAVAIALYKLFQKDKDKQEQLNKMTGLVGALEAQNELIKEGNDNMRNYLIEMTKGSNNDLSDRLIELEEQRLRLVTKPAIWSNGGGYKGYEGSVNISVDNRGEICFIDDFEIVEGDEIDLNKWSRPVPLEKNGHVRITGDVIGGKHPKEVRFKIRLDYHDQENYRYQTIIEWVGGITNVLETIDLPKND
ncbi:hypothetical protein [Ekhidna sp.]|uniref:hypothetical protein n=1 Tax=Ekhidna sp. TaxID=2608089 RepID=UPI0032EFD154